MKYFFAGIGSIMKVTLIEMQRQRVWLIAVLVAIGLMVFLPSIRAVDDAARIRLSVVAILSCSGFIATLLAILLAASLIRRDYSQRIGFMLFSKPLPMPSYLLGRWAGLQAALLGMLAMIALAGTAAVALGSSSGLPHMQLVQTAQGWQRNDALGSEHQIYRKSVSLAGLPGNGIVYHFPAQAIQENSRLLVKAVVAGAMPGSDQERSPVVVTAWPTATADTGKEETVLRLAEDSPYGRVEQAGQQQLEQVMLWNRGDSRTDLENDYLRLSLPVGLAHQDFSIKITRVDPQSLLVFHKSQSVLCSQAQGSFLPNLCAGLAIVLAQSGLLCACAISLASIANIGVTLLGGLVLYFAGHSLQLVEDVLRIGKMPLFAARGMELLVAIVPDFQLYPVGAQLAAGQAIPWSQVGSAWAYYGLYAVLFFIGAWFMLKRREA